LQDKSEAQRVIKKFIRRAQNKFELKIKNIRSNKGSEFRNLNVEKYLDEEGISMSSQLLILLNKMALLKGRIELLLR
jgi:hypothetical protein